MSNARDVIEKWRDENDLHMAVKDCHISDLVLRLADCIETDRMQAAIRSVLADITYETPAGTTNCRFCDHNMDHDGTHLDQHDKACVVHDLRAVLVEK